MRNSFMFTVEHRDEDTLPEMGKTRNINHIRLLESIFKVEFEWIFS